MTRSSLCTAWLVFLVLAGCTSESTPPAETPEPDAAASSVPAPTPIEVPAPLPEFNGSSNRPAFVRWASVMPDPLVLSGPVTVMVEAEDPEGQAVSLKHQWVVNDLRLKMQTGPSLPPEVLKRGDRVAVELVALDPRGLGSPFRTTEVQVANTPPEVTEIMYEPYPLRVNQHLTAHVKAEDVDGDDVTYTFRWTVHNQVVAEDESGSLNLTGYVRGDEIAVEITPHDGTAKGEPQQGTPIKIANSAPEITSSPPPTIGRGQYTYDVVATDPDGDTLTFALQSAPAGMTIDPRSGQLEWRFGREAAGTHQVRVTVTDGYAEEPSWQEFQLNILGRGGR